MPHAKKYVKCPHCGASLKAENLSAHLGKVHPETDSIPSIEIELEGKPLKIYLPCERIYRRYEETLKKEIANSESLIEKIWREVSTLFEFREKPVPKIWIVIGKGAIAHFIHGQAFSSLPITIDIKNKILHAYEPNLQFTPYTYYIESLMRLKNEPILAEAFIHEFSHNAFILGGPKDKGYLLEFAYRASNPNMNSFYTQLIPFAGILPDQNFPLTPATLLTEAPAMWSEERIADKLLADAVARMKRRIQFGEKRDEVLNRYTAKYFRLSPLTPEEHARILSDHWEAVRTMSLSELYKYVEGELEKILKIDINTYYHSFEQFCKIEVHKECGPPPTYDPSDDMSVSWSALLEKEFGYID